MISKTKHNNLPHDKWHCILPWVQLQIQVDGRVYVCCRTQREEPIGHLKKQTLQEIWNNEAIRKMRKTISAGNWPDECKECFETERLGCKGTRQKANFLFNHLKERISETNLDGSLTNCYPVALDLRFSNVCNYNCRICESNFSTKWYSDAKELGLFVPSNKKQSVTKSFPDVWNQLIELIDDLEYVYFAGGEPLIMEEHFKFIDLLLEKKRKKVHLEYNTNLSVLSWKGRELIKIWKQFKKVTIVASIDGIEKAGEYQRKGMSWQQTIANWQTLNKRCSHINFEIFITVSIFNIFHLLDLIKKVLSLKMVKPEGIIINMLVSPQHYNIRILPKRLKHQAKAKYFSFIKKELLANYELHNILPVVRSLRSIINYMYESDMQYFLPQFQQITKSMDQLRNENFQEVFPELSDLLIQ